MAVLTRYKIASIVSNISLVTNQPVLINDCIQIALNRMYQAYDWPYYMTDDGLVKTIPLYNTGTVDATQDSTTITMAVGVVSTNFIGRKIRVGDGKPWYKITAVDTALNTLTIDAPYQGTTVTLSTYDIYQDEYELDSDVDKYKTMRQFQNGIPMLDITPQKFDEMYPTPQNYADPIYSVMVGSEMKEYSTGVISGSNTTITGVGTTWLSNPRLAGLGKMSLIRVNTNVYTISSVNSDTSITTFEAFGTIGVNSTYTIMMNNLMVQLYQIPNAQRVLRYRYFRIPTPLANDYDVPDMPHEFHHLLIWGALSEILSQKGDINKAYQVYEARFVEGLGQMRMKLGSFAPNRVTRRRSVDTTSRVRRMDGLETSSFDRRYSM